MLRNIRHRQVPKNYYGDSPWKTCDSLTEAKYCLRIALLNSGNIHAMRETISVSPAQQNFLESACNGDIAMLERIRNIIAWRREVLKKFDALAFGVEVR